jgi:xanthine dehydrogenase YagS FAD-binding subunit
MRGFEYYRVTTVRQALALLAKHGEKAALLAGGSDLLSIMKDRLEGPKFQLPQHLLDIGGIREMGVIKEGKKGLRVGAGATLADLASSPLVGAKYPILSQAAGQVAVPQIRNVGTLGGNLCQRPRCWYFRGRLFKDCLRKGGDTCYAQMGENQYHALFGAETCCMVCPSDMGTALSALEARVEIATPKGVKKIPIAEFFLKPENNVLKETVLGPGEIVLAVEIPPPAVGSRGIFLKLKERQAFDFALASVAAQVTLTRGVVYDACIILGGVATFPVRATGSERALKGRSIMDVVATACEAAVMGARPLSNNAYKVMAIKGMLEKALTSLV